MRQLFGVMILHRCGFFVDYCLSAIIHGFLPFYPKGNHVLAGHKAGVFVAVASNDGPFLFTGSSDTTIIKWDLLTNQVLRQWPAHRTSVGRLVHHSPHLISLGYHREKILIWDDSTCMLIRTVVDHGCHICTMNLNREGDRLVTVNNKHTIRVWNVETGQCESVLDSNPDRIQFAYFMPDGWLLSAATIRVKSSSDLSSVQLFESIKLWSMVKGREHRTVKIEQINVNEMSVSVNRDESLIAYHYGSVISLYQWPQMHVIKKIMVESRVVCFHPTDPDILAIGGDSVYSMSTLSVIQIYHVRKKECLFTIDRQWGSIRCLGFTNDGSRMFSISNDYTLRLWDVSHLSDVP